MSVGSAPGSTRVCSTGSRRRCAGTSAARRRSTRRRANGPARASTGSSRRSSPNANSRNGRATASCGRRRSSRCAKTTGAADRPRSAAANRNGGDDERNPRGAWRILASPQPDTAHGRKHGARASASAGDTQRGAAADRVGRVRITHPERVLDPQSGTRKIDLAHYWQWVAPWLLPDLKGRPVSLVRARATSPANCSSRSMPSAARSRSSRSTKADPGHGPLLSIDSVDALLGAAQMGTVELHVERARVERRAAGPHRVRPRSRSGAAVARDDRRRAARARAARRAGPRVVLQDERRQAARRRAAHAACGLGRREGFLARGGAARRARAADRFTATMGPRHRAARSSSTTCATPRGTIAAYSVRARPGMGVSVPLDWDEVPDTTGGAQWTIDTLRERLDALKRDPWEGYAHARQRITASMRARLGAET